VITCLGFALDNNKASIGVDIMSGDDKPGDNNVKTYRANYYFAHMLYGWMDYFVVNPKYGVIDYRFEGDFGILPNAAGNPTVTFKPQIHFFQPHSAPKNVDDPYGIEYNIEAHLALFPKSNIILGAALFDAGKLAYELADTKTTANTKDIKSGWFFYFMPVFNF
jgi:hypothetical protein